MERCELVVKEPKKKVLKMKDGKSYPILMETERFYICEKQGFRKSNPFIDQVVFEEEKKAVQKKERKEPVVEEEEKRDRKEGELNGTV